MVIGRDVGNIFIADGHHINERYNDEPHDDDDNNAEVDLPGKFSSSREFVRGEEALNPGNVHNCMEEEV